MSFFQNFGKRVLGAMACLMSLTVVISTFGSANGTLFAAGRSDSSINVIRNTSSGNLSTNLTTIFCLQVTFCGGQRRAYDASRIARTYQKFNTNAGSHFHGEFDGSLYVGLYVFFCEGIYFFVVLLTTGRVPITGDIIITK